jgi:hypothetical protein
VVAQFKRAGTGALPLHKIWDLISSVIAIFRLIFVKWAGTLFKRAGTGALPLHKTNFKKRGTGRNYEIYSNCSKNT